MSARLHRIGNIYSRIEGLIRKNYMSEDNRPLWFDIYKRFPPKYEPTFKRLEPEIPIKIILYKEDVLRAKIHKAYHDRLGVVDLNDNGESVTQKLMKTFQRYILEGMSENEAMEKLNSYTETIINPKKLTQNLNSTAENEK